MLTPSGGRQWATVRRSHQAPGANAHATLPKANPEKTLSCFAGLVVPAGGPYPIPFRTRPSNPPAPMVLRLKTRESRSLPGLQSTKLKTSLQNLLSTSPAPKRWTKPSHPAGWSSPVARQAHNLKVVSSNLAPATKYVPRPVHTGTGRFAFEDHGRARSSG